MSDYFESNMLDSGEVDNFICAMKLVVLQCKREKRELQPDPQPDSDEKRYEATLNAYIAVAKRCEAEYLARLREEELRLAREWQRDEDENVRRIGDTLEKQDYRSLAL